MTQPAVDFLLAHKLTVEGGGILHLVILVIVWCLDRPERPQSRGRKVVWCMNFHHVHHYIGYLLVWGWSLSLYSYSIVLSVNGWINFAKYDAATLSNFFNIIVQLHRIYDRLEDWFFFNRQTVKSTYSFGWLTLIRVFF